MLKADCCLWTMEGKLKGFLQGKIAWQST